MSRAYGLQEFPHSPDEMTLRDCIAIHAMAAIISKSNFVVSSDETLTREISEKTAIGAYTYADAMLAERGRDK